MNTSFQINSLNSQINCFSQDCDRMFSWPTQSLGQQYLSWVVNVNEGSDCGK